MGKKTTADHLEDALGHLVQAAQALSYGEDRDGELIYLWERVQACVRRVTKLIDCPPADAERRTT